VTFPRQSGSGPDEGAAERHGFGPAPRSRLLPRHSKRRLETGWYQHAIRVPTAV